MIKVCNLILYVFCFILAVNIANIVLPALLGLDNSLAPILVVQFIANIYLAYKWHSCYRYVKSFTDGILKVTDLKRGCEAGFKYEIVTDSMVDKVNRINREITLAEEKRGRCIRELHAANISEKDIGLLFNMPACEVSLLCKTLVTPK